MDCQYRQLFELFEILCGGKSLNVWEEKAGSDLKKNLKNKN